MQKLYCYVDENGQDTNGRLFIVSTVVLKNNRDLIFSKCEEIEHRIKKGNTKWRTTSHAVRMDYLRLIFSDSEFQNTLSYSVFHNCLNYDQATISGISRALTQVGGIQPYTSLVYVDGLSKVKRREYAVGLRDLGIQTNKVRGVAKEENNSLIRLADMVAGFVRDALKGEDAEIVRMYVSAQRRGMLIKLEE